MQVLELGVGAEVLRGVGWLFLVGFVLALLVALLRPTTLQAKAFWALLVVAIFIGPATPSVLRDLRHKQRYAKAKALFEERCRTAGEKIYRTVDKVDGVLLKQVRSAGEPTNPMMSGAAAAHEFTGADYIRYFLLFQREGTQRLGEEASSLPGYRYVDSFGEDGVRYRYTLDSNAQLRRERAPEDSPRYAVLIEDIVDPNEREFWVAGSKIVLMDLARREPVGEFIRYVIDPGQGHRQSHRTPWLFAVGCRMNHGYGSYSPQLFARKVLTPAGAH